MVDVGRLVRKRTLVVVRELMIVVENVVEDGFGGTREVLACPLAG